MAHSMDVREQLRELAQKSLLNSSQFVVDVIQAGKNAHTQKIVIIIDGDNGVTIDDCVEISRKLSVALDERALIVDRYLLEVSTPGLDHPLAMRRQYPKNIGRNLKVHLKEKKIVMGKLTGADAEKITLIQEMKEGKKWVTENLDIAYADIEKAFVMVSFK
jgi:ribosome maturation factor RimP